MLYERLVLIHELLAEDGSLYLHFGSNVSHYGQADSATRSSGAESFTQRDRLEARRPLKRHSDKAHGIRAAATRVDPAVPQGRRVHVERRSLTAYDQELHRRELPASSSPRRVAATPDDMIGPGGEAKGESALRGSRRHAVLAVSREETHAGARRGRRIVVQTKPGSVPQLKRYLDEMAEALPLADLWTDIPPCQASGHRAHRIRHAEARSACSSASSSVVSNQATSSPTSSADPGPPLVVAEKLGRRWIALRPRSLRDPHDAQAPAQHPRLPPVRHQEPRRLRAPALAGRSRATARSARTWTRSSPSTAPSPSRASPTSTAARPTGWSTSAPPMLR